MIKDEVMGRHGIARTTSDIDIVVVLSEQQVQALAAHYPPPRYYADPEQIYFEIPSARFLTILLSNVILAATFMYAEEIASP